MPQKQKPYNMPQHISTVENTLKTEAIAEDQKNPLLMLSNRTIKRTFDLFAGLLVCIISLPFLPIIALIIKMQSRGPIVFKQERTGLDGKTFVCYKFRTMRLNDECDTLQATANDPRIFPFGSFMRRTHIDEIPNSINVIKGDMSIIGPRPHMLYHTRKYTQLIDNYMDRHRCKPGITGYSQVLGLSGETPEVWQMAERVKHDIWYIKHWSIGLDLWILYRTVVVTFCKRRQNNI